jgi:hypothetical protein
MAIAAGTRNRDISRDISEGVDPRTVQTLTANDTSTVDGTYGAEEALVLAANRTRILEIERLLQQLGLLA